MECQDEAYLPETRFWSRPCRYSETWETFYTVMLWTCLIVSSVFNVTVVAIMWTSAHFSGVQSKNGKRKQSARRKRRNSKMRKHARVILTGQAFAIYSIVIVLVEGITSWPYYICQGVVIGSQCYFISNIVSGLVKTHQAMLGNRGSEKLVEWYMFGVSVYVFLAHMVTGMLISYFPALQNMMVSIFVSFYHVPVAIVSPVVLRLYVRRTVTQLDFMCDTSKAGGKMRNDLLDLRRRLVNLTGKSWFHMSISFLVMSLGLLNYGDDPIMPGWLSGCYYILCHTGSISGLCVISPFLLRDGDLRRFKHGLYQTLCCCGNSRKNLKFIQPIDGLGDGSNLDTSLADEDEPVEPEPQRATSKNLSVRQIGLDEQQDKSICTTSKTTPK